MLAYYYKTKNQHFKSYRLYNILINIYILRKFTKKQHFKSYRLYNLLINIYILRKFI